MSGCVCAACQWCHGAPGLAFACIKAYELWHDAKYLQVARESAEVVWQRGLLKKGATTGTTGGTAKEGCVVTGLFSNSNSLCAFHAFARVC